MKNSSIIFLLLLILGGVSIFNLAAVQRKPVEMIERERDYKAEELYVDDNLDSEIETDPESEYTEPEIEPEPEEEVSKTNIEIINNQNDDEKTKYTYNVIIRDVTGATRYSVDGVESYTVFSSNGEATFTINSNQKLIIYDIPYNTYYSIEQATNNKYVTSVGNKNQNIIEGVTAQANIITFYNTNKVVSANPNTADYSIIYIATAVLSLIAFIVLIKTVKVKRFTN